MEQGHNGPKKRTVKFSVAKTDQLDPILAQIIGDTQHGCHDRAHESGEHIKQVMTELMKEGNTTRRS